MSSWANIRVPRKRDLSQIPEQLRPVVIARAQRPEVIVSESYQSSSDVQNNQDFFNLLVDSTMLKQSKKESAPPKNEYISKKIEAKPAPGAFELTHQGRSYVFVILRHLRTPKDNDLWISAYNSIRRFYSNKIIIIDDNSHINTVNGKLFDTEIIQSEFPGAGEILPYYYFLQNKWADTMIFIHDSMSLFRPFQDKELDHDVRFHWHFTSNGFDDQRKIKNYLLMLQNIAPVVEFYSDPLSSWKGCSGGATIIHFDVVQALEDKYKLFSLLTMSIKTRKDRESFERILGIILYQEGFVNDSNCSNFGDILRYPGAFESENNNADTAAHIVKQRGYDTAIVKVWRGR
jgi:hypothetical protein